MLQVRTGALPDAAIQSVPGLAPHIDAVAAYPPHAFLRSQWYSAASPEAVDTLVGRRGDGSVFAALPLARTGRLPLRSVPGSYWPFRSFPMRADADADEIAALLGSNVARPVLAPAWRLGPVYRSDPSASLVVDAMHRLGWTILTRSLGHSYVLDIGKLRAGGDWPRKSTLSRARNYEKQLGLIDPIRWSQLPASNWTDETLSDLAAIEANSWVGNSTDGSGAKFLRPAQRLYWQRAARDPLLGEALSVLILYVGARPAAFAFDLRCGDTVYGIASSYDEAFARFRPGKIVTWRGIDHWIGAGVRRIDWGAGDSGYKREAGAEAAEEIVDYLFVQNRTLAALLRSRWEIRPPEEEAKDVPKRDGFSVLEHAIMGAILTSAAVAAME